VAGGWRRLHDDDLHNLYASPNIIRVMQSWRIRWTGHVACMRKINAYSIFVGRPEGKNHFEDLDVDGKIILERILGKYSRKL
jgi:hypothetical protein